MIRAIPANASDNVYCTLLAHSAIHGAMAGYTGFTVGPVNGRHAYIPLMVGTLFLPKVFRYYYFSSLFFEAVSFLADLFLPLLGRLFLLKQNNRHVYLTRYPTRYP